MRQRCILLLLLSFFTLSYARGKEAPAASTGEENRFVLKSNLLYLATGSLNAGAEVRLTENWSLALSGGYNPWTFSNNKKIKHWAVNPEARYWPSTVFSGHFVGLHALCGEFNAGGVSLLGLSRERREGSFTGMGFSYGYVMPLTEKWHLEGSVGLGYAYQDYKRFNCVKCGELIGKSHKNYVGPTKIGISLIYGF